MHILTSASCLNSKFSLPVDSNAVLWSHISLHLQSRQAGYRISTSSALSFSSIFLHATIALNQLETAKNPQRDQLLAMAFSRPRYDTLDSVRELTLSAEDLEAMQVFFLIFNEEQSS
jgi:hypothetical protein